VADKRIDKYTPYDYTRRSLGVRIGRQTCLGMGTYCWCDIGEYAGEVVKATTSNVGKCVGLAVIKVALVPKYDCSIVY
jgi:hypothetical protein